MNLITLDVFLTLIAVWMTAMTGCKSKLLPNLSKRCAPKCICDSDEFNRKRIVCEQGGLNDIPTAQMDKDIKVLIITAPVNNENKLSLGRIFLAFENLKVIKITHSRLPAIGDSTFWPGDNLELIDLSHNHIKLVNEKDFKGLENLEHLDLSDNRIADTPSAPFRYLINLRKLNLAGNLISRIVPQMFWNMQKLEHLDLSDNKLGSLRPYDLSYVQSLKYLSLSNCSLRTLSRLLFESFSNLQHLDLSHNQISHIYSFTFQDLTNLKTLLLDHNQLIIINDNTFSKLNLYYLGLSYNQITTLSSSTFNNSKIESLDLSFNTMHEFEPNLLTFLANSLFALNVSHNTKLSHPMTSVYNLLQPLKKIQHLSLSGLNLNQTLDLTIFANYFKLISLDLSCNQFSEFNSKLFEPLKRLEILNISFNRFKTLDESIFKAISSMTTLKVFSLNNNPWSCNRCHVLPFINWLNTFPPSYFNLCSQNNLNSESNCVKCHSPAKLKGKNIHLITDSDIEWCSSENHVQMKLTTTNHTFGILLGFILFFSLVLLIVVILIVYQKSERVYYTNEAVQEDGESQKKISLSLSKNVLNSNEQTNGLTKHGS